MTKKAPRHDFLAITATAALLLAPQPASAKVTQEVRDGYQITRRVSQRQVPVTEMRDQTQTTYKQQITTDNYQSQQLYSVPVTQYQMVSKLKGRWNPLVTPYWTHEMRPVTTWQQQVGTVSVPVTRSAWVPETRTVQVPVTTYRTAEEVTETRVALSPTAGRSSNTALADTRGPSATLAARPSTSLPSSNRTAIAAKPLGGVALENDPPRQATGWRPPTGGRY
ncbi:hypothetical protein [Adhaeretor mobilis]|uniref:Secreted protein n=1 Tax=Adhaeretor mobilis TaxID=1930276 RepID=A0A517MXN9_9BACT|nr:hypothetical protein [Adhaeretor mobilis]QDS99629.1 hypothetical protein HG15A2_29550 [Adhaeretor mobilis]